MLPGKDKHLILLVVSLLLPLTAAGQAGKMYKYHFDGDLHKAGVVSGGQNLLINYSISELDIESLKNNSGDFYKITIPGHNPSSVPGKPMLPVLSRLIEVPENSNIVIRISDVKTQRILPSKADFKGVLYPKQVDDTKDVQKQKTGFIIDKTLYSNRGFLKSDTVRVEYLGRIRNKQLATLYISPVRYDPYKNELEVITSMKVEVSFDLSKGILSPSSGEKSVLFNQSLDKGVLNYNPSEVITGYSDQPVKMIILTDTVFRKYLTPLIKWKTQKGYKVTTLYRGTGMAGNTFAEMKDTLSRIYKSGTVNDPAPEYLLIVGDVTRIPPSDGTSNTSDLYWGEFDGNGDYIPDMYIGRLPVTDTNQVKAVVSKIIQYEKFQFADSNNFYTRALITAGNDAGYADYMNGQVRYAVNYYLNPANKIDGYHFYYTQSASAEDTIKKLIKNGLSFINYTGHGDSNGWLDPAIKVSDVSSMQNKNMYPFVITNACRTAQYNLPGSFGNTMMVSDNKGAIGYIGCSNDSYWDEDFYWTVGNGVPNSDPKYNETGLGALDRLFHTNGESPSDWYISMGQVNFAGNLSVSASTSSRKKYYWETYTLLGDPSVVPYIGQPDSFKIALPDTLPNGIKSFSLNLDPFSYVAVSHFDTLWDASYASPSGSAVLDMPGISDDSCLIVITGQNKIPLIKKTYISNFKKEYINLSSSVINDAAANNNGLADWDESFFLKLTVSNLGQTDATQLYAKISTISDYATIINDSVYIGTLSAKSQDVLANNFKIKIAKLIPDKAYLTINLKLKDSKTEKNYKIDICLHAPVLEILSYTIDDSLTGNANFFADPGETLRLNFKVKNSGSSDISGILKITSQSAGLTIPEQNIYTGVLPYGESVTIPVTVSLSPDILPGSSLNISSLLDCDPYFNSKSFSLPVGKTIENFEYQTFSFFPWNNTSAYPWIITDGNAYDGQFSARSAVISNNTESLLKISVNIPAIDTVRFFVKVSSELDYDFLVFRLNGKEIFKISGETDWIGKKVELQEGFNLLEWIYRKDQSVSSGSDCAWLDFISFPIASFSKTDLKTGKILTPEPNKSYNLEKITAAVINFGTDTIKTFNLAYCVNDNIPVSEQFNKLIRPSDTLDVVFTQPADLSGNGTYKILVYGFNNNDSYLANDTASLSIVNTGITPLENTQNKFIIMPNPFAQYFRIIVESKTSDNVRLSIYNPAGKLLWEEEFAILPGENILTVSPDTLPPGFYTLRLKGGTILKVARIVKSE
jgi:hypothetical protein